MLSLRLLLNRMSSSRREEVAALKIQVAWSKYLDTVYSFDAGHKAPPSKSKDGVALQSARNNHIDQSPMGALADSSTSDTQTFSPGEAKSLRLDKLDKLDRIDTLFMKVEQLIERVEKVAPRSGGGRIKG